MSTPPRPAVISPDEEGATERFAVLFQLQRREAELKSKQTQPGSRAVFFLTQKPFGLSSSLLGRSTEQLGPAGSLSSQALRTPWFHSQAPAASVP